MLITLPNFMFILKFKDAGVGRVQKTPFKSWLNKLPIVHVHINYFLLATYVHCHKVWVHRTQ